MKLLAKGDPITVMFDPLRGDPEIPCRAYVIEPRYSQSYACVSPTTRALNMSPRPHRGAHADEGVDWVRGHFPPETKAMRAAAAL